ncbi:MAG: glycosyltransferase [Terrimicrobiaceae bacterium]
MRIVFGSMGSLGDLHPMLALACGARGRGHEVVVAASPEYATNVARAGLDFHPLRPVISPEADRLAYFFDMKRGPQRLLREVVFAEVRATHADLMAATRGADLLVVGELLYTAPMVAEALGIPWMNVVLAPTSMLSATDPCVLAPAPWLHALRHAGPWLHRLAYFFGRIQGGMWARSFYRFRRELGLPPGGNPIFDAKHSRHGTLVMFPDFLGAPQPDWPCGTVQTGFPFYDQPGGAGKAEAFLRCGEPPVVFTLGSIVAHFEPSFYHAAAEAARLLGRRAILLTGRNANVPCDLPESVLVLDYVPLHDILPRAAAVVHAGGIGTCAEALRAGLPSVVVPYAFDQPDNAARLWRLGVAEILPRRAITPRRLAEKLEAILNSPSPGERASVLAGLIDVQGAVEGSINAMEAAVLKVGE